MSEGVRIDRWLCSARMFKSRTQATDACTAGQVKLGETAVKASHLVRVGDRLVVDCPRGRIVLEVAELGDKRLSPQLAQKLYIDHSPPPEPKDPFFGDRDRGTGRPTKRDRREVDALREQLTRRR